jgi:hypothetical protein
MLIGKLSRVFAFLLACMFTSAYGSDDDAYYITQADLPIDAPLFEQFPAAKRLNKPPAPADIKRDRSARMFRTVLTQSAKKGPNFAGHYTVVLWGCGSGCVALAIVDADSGKVYFPSNLLSVDNMAVELTTLIDFRIDSRLLIVVGGINDDPALRGISYFVWEHNRLKRIKFYAKPL